MRAASPRDDGATPVDGGLAVGKPGGLENALGLGRGSLLESAECGLSHVNLYLELKPLHV